MNTNSVAELMQQEARFVALWLDTRLTQDQADEESFHWQGLAQGAATQACKKNDLEWAAIAIRLYEWLETAVPNTPPDSFLHDTMFLRVNMIVAMGPQTGHPILDPAVIVSSFEAIAPSPSEMKAIAQRSRRENLHAALEVHGVQELKRLRRIRNRFYPVKLLSENGLLESESRLEAWMALYESLP